MNAESEQDPNAPALESGSYFLPAIAAGSYFRDRFKGAYYQCLNQKCKIQLFGFDRLHHCLVCHGDVEYVAPKKENT